MRTSLYRPIIVVSDLTHIYHSGTSLEKKALEEISFEVGEGECVAIVGETGSGKTTLVQHLNGLLKPDRGRILVEGMEVNQSPAFLADLRRRVGLVFQYPEHQLFEETVRDDISFVLRQSSGLAPAEITVKVKKACASVGLDYEKFHQRSPFELSSGEMRRVALAGVLIQDPKILILDEPTVGLDPDGKREILSEIRDLQRAGKTVIIVSHQVEEILPLIDRLVVLDRGKTYVSGTPSQVFSFLLREKIFLFLVPPLFRLLAELREEGWDIPRETVFLEEALLALRKNLPSPNRQ